MKPVFAVVVFSLSFCLSLTAQHHPSQRPGPLAHTFSIVARDAATGEVGVAVQSHWFCVGCIVTWAEAGVGAVATQSFVEPAYGRDGLRLMRQGVAAPEALARLLKEDVARNVRQVAFIDAAGRVGTWTGSKDIPAAGDLVGTPSGGHPESITIDGAPEDGRIHVGDGFSVQANMMLNDRVWPAMARAFRETGGDLADRMLAALDAGQAAGGDARGRQSAALLIVRGRSTGRPWQDRIFDLRVDDAEYPLKELRRLVLLQRAYNHMNAGDLAVEKGDREGALREYGAAERIAAATPDILPSRLNEMRFWHAVALVNMNRLDEALPMLRRVFAADRNWVLMAERLPKVGLLPDDPEVIQRILDQSPSK